MQARALADAGFGVLQIDLYGCGDSDGELRDASWQIWKLDLAAAAEWLAKHVAPPISLWGLRLGATLALDFARDAQAGLDRILLWQPVVNGKTFMTQFLRLRLAADMLAAGDRQEHRTAVPDCEELIEVGGYELSQTLISDISTRDFSNLSGIGCPVHWFEIVPSADLRIPAARMSIMRAWMDADVELHVHNVAGTPFWTGAEPGGCPQLIAATTDAFARALA